MQDIFFTSAKPILNLHFSKILIVVFVLAMHSCGADKKKVAIAPADQKNIDAALSGSNPSYFKQFTGVNGFEWDFLQDPSNPNDALHIYEPHMQLIQTFGAFRHYLDWDKIEPKQGIYTYNPTANGGWNLDVIYERCKQAGILVDVCLKTLPGWLQETYPADMRDAEDVPAPYGADLNKPDSYILQAKAAFQFAARYGANKNIDTALISINTKPRWTDDSINHKKIGLDLIKYIECDNERDKTWKGPKAYQTPEQYAANLSAFYDGDKGRLGKNIGVKTADQTMKVVMGGLATPDVKYLQRMIAWCVQHRGYRADGSVNLCFDVINYHYYAHNDPQKISLDKKQGVAPELSDAGSIADQFVALGKKYNLPVWVTETGYDVNEDSPQAAVKIGDKTVLQTQADWLLRTSLLYARHGINEVFFYMLNDVNKANPQQYSSSGLLDGGARRPAANYFEQIKTMMNGFRYSETLKTDPLLDVYVSGKKKIYIVTVPDQNGREVICQLDLGAAKQASVYTLKPDAVFITPKILKTNNGKLSVTATETPLFITVD